MKVLDRLFGARGDYIRDPEALRERLYQAVARDDQPALVALCATNRKLIGAHFHEWRKPAPEVVADPRLLQQHLHRHVAIARCFADRLGDPSLLEGFQAKRDPTARWIKDLEHTDGLIRLQRFEEALVDLLEIESDVSKWSGFPAMKIRALVLGRIGNCLFQTLQPESALARFEQVSDLCLRAGDAEGVRTSLRSRMEVLRWLNRHPEAGPLADQLAGLLEGDGSNDEAARLRSRGRVMARGEPLLRALFMTEGRVFELDELPTRFSGRGDVLFERNRMTLLRCELLTREGASHGEAGRYEKALASFAAAMKADPFEPHPHYETAFTHMLHQRYEQAIESYERTHQLAPRWFQVGSGLWLARQLLAGRFHSSVPGAMRALESPPTPEKGLELGTVLIQSFPDLAGAWALLADHLTALGRSADAQAAIRSGLACAEEPDVRTRLLANLGAQDRQANRAELEEAAALNGNLIAGTLARVILHMEANTSA